MEEFWKDINHVPLVTTTYSIPLSSSSSVSPPPPPSAASKLHEFFTTQPFPLNNIDLSSTSAATSSVSLFPSSGSHKRLSQSDCDRRSKRMIKNRESAARSRARKQAYTYELEQKLTLLKEENAMLTKQLEQLDEAPANNKQKLKKPPYRTLTAPF